MTGKLASLTVYAGLTRQRLLHPPMHLAVEHVERQRTLTERRVMKRPQIEASTETRTGFGAQLQELELAEFVGERLTRPRNVAIDLALHVRLVHRRIGMEVVDHLLPRPMLGVDPRVDHQSNRTPHLVFEPTVVAVRILIEPDLLAESLGIERPPLDERGIPAMLPEL